MAAHAKTVINFGFSTSAHKTHRTSASSLRFVSVTLSAPTGYESIDFYCLSDTISRDVSFNFFVF